MNEQQLWTSGADVLSSTKKLRKTLWGEVASTPAPLVRQGVKKNILRFRWELNPRPFRDNRML